MPNEENPFAPGVDGATAASEPSHTIYEPVDLEVGEILNRCWQIFKDNPGIVLIAFFVPLVFSLVFQGIEFGLQMGIAEATDENVQLALMGASIGNSIVNLLLSLFINLGVIRVFLNLTRGHDADAMMIFSQGSLYLSGLGTAILTGLLVIVGFLLLVIPGIVAAIGLQFVMYLVVDKQMSPIDAITGSWQLTDGHKLMIFLINFLIGLFAIALTCVTFGLALFVIAPVFSLTQAVMYHSLTHMKHGASDLV